MKAQRGLTGEIVFSDRSLLSSKRLFSSFFLFFFVFVPPSLPHLNQLGALSGVWIQVLNISVT